MLQDPCGLEGPRCWNFQGFVIHQAEDMGFPNCTTRLETLEFVGGFLWTTCLKMLEFPWPPSKMLELLELLRTTRLKTLEFVRFFGEISRVWSVLPPSRRCRLCRDSYWDLEEDRHMHGRSTLPGCWLRKREINCPENEFM